MTPEERLAELGYPTRAIGRYILKTLQWRERIQSEKFNLAVTAALEHYTATLAETLLGNPEARDEIGDFYTPTRDVRGQSIARHGTPSGVC